MGIAILDVPQLEFVVLDIRREFIMSHVWSKFYPEGTASEVDLSKWSSVADALEQACLRFPESIALTCLGADLSYRQFDRLANQLAAYLQHDLGLKKGDRLAIMLPNIMQLPIAFFAAQKIGVVCVNTNPLYTPREMRHQFKDSGAKALVMIDLFMNHLEEVIQDTPIEHVIVTSVGDQLPAWKGLLIKGVMKLKGMIPKHKLKAVPFRKALALGAKQTYSAPDLSHKDISILQYTGGTTGVSKGAVLLQSNVLANMAQIQHLASVQVTPGQEYVLTALPLYHVFALTVNFLAFVAMGQRMILVPKPIPVSNLVKIFKKYPISVMTGVNTLFNALVNDPGFQAAPPRHLKFSIGGGMAVQSAVSKKWQQLTGQPIVEGFGLTEASPVTHVNPLNGQSRSGSIGIPLASTNAKVVDEDGREVANGETGELIVQGPQVMAGYWNRPEETKGVLRNDWLWTGDIARRDGDGFFYIVDRKKDMILVSGFNVYPSEIEEVLTAHPKVLEAAVIGIPDDTSGEAVKAFVVLRDPSLSIEELRQYCSSQLTGYKRPRLYEFRAELPKSNVGKILRRLLRDDAATSIRKVG